jgi:hypothetical protein
MSINVSTHWYYMAMGVIKTTDVSCIATAQNYGTVYVNKYSPTILEIALIDT